MYQTFLKNISRAIDRVLIVSEQSEDKKQRDACRRRIIKKSRLMKDTYKNYENMSEEEFVHILIQELY